MVKGKNYFTRKKAKQSDLYHTPFSLVWELLKYESFANCLEPACGEYAIVKAAQNNSNCDFSLAYDINDYNTGNNFFDQDKWYGDILTNPPFNEWDRFVLHAKKICTGKIAMIGKINYFGCVGRANSSIWKNLQKIYIFNRYVDYRTPYREDGFFHVGGMCTAWFVWLPKYTGDIILKQLDVQKYAKLGQFKC